MVVAPVEAVSAVLSTLPGAGVAKRLADGVLDAVGAVSPQARRMAVYAGAGLLGVAGVVEWPVVATVAAAAWLTQPRPDEPRTAPGDVANAGTGGSKGSGRGRVRSVGAAAPAAKTRAGASTSRAKGTKKTTTG
jgi:hypothetical protein